MDLDFILANLAISIPVALITSFFASIFAIKNFYKKEVWLRKEKEYSKILDVLSDLIYYHNGVIDYFISHDEMRIDDEVDVEPLLKVLEILSSTQSLLVSDKIITRVRTLVSEISKRVGDEARGDHFSYVDRINHEISNAHRDILKVAKKDLKL